MTARQPEPFDALAAVTRAIDSVRELLTDGTADEVSCEITKHGTFKLMAKRAGQGTVVRHEFKARPGK